MIKAVLLDLDDTLLRIDTDAFVKGYLTQLGAFIADRRPDLSSDVVRGAIRAGVRASIKDLNPSRSNASVISGAIADHTSLSPAELDTLMGDFFAGKYTELSSTASPVDGAAALIEHLLAQGLNVVVATNPLFPHAALVGRLSWAGIDLAKTPVTLLTSVDNMHFTKPNPHYYEEILARIGVEAEDALMVGDSIENDMIPAARAGLSTFWIPWDRSLPVGVTPNGVGTLRDLDRCIREGWLATLTPHPRTAEQLEPRMLGNVAALLGIVEEMDSSLWNAHPDPTEWSPLEIVCHLRDSESTVQRPRLLRILNEDNPFIEPPAAPPGPGERDVSGENGMAALRAFTDARAETLKMLSEVSADDWNRTARHSIFGPTTLLEMAHFTARHDRLHIHQLCEAVGRCKI